MLVSRRILTIVILDFIYCVDLLNLGRLSKIKNKFKIFIQNSCRIMLNGNPVQLRFNHEKGPSYVILTTILFFNEFFLTLFVLSKSN